MLIPAMSDTDMVRVSVTDKTKGGLWQRKKAT